MSNILGRFEVELDLVAIVPQIPCNFPKLYIERWYPAFPGILLPEPKEVRFLHTGPFDGDRAFGKD
jgi:hypothetical protein